MTPPRRMVLTPLRHVKDKFNLKSQKTSDACHLENPDIEELPIPRSKKPERDREAAELHSTFEELQWGAMKKADHDASPSIHLHIFLE
jgi:hypothetical protein